MIEFKQFGDFKKSNRFLSGINRIRYNAILNKYGRDGVRALAAATPVDSRETASSWDYKVSIKKGQFSVTWINSNVIDGVPIAILLQYGHATRNGGYVQGRDYINPALKPIFDRLAQEAWKEITRL